ncbi:MAG: methionine adenosyltransferase [candidate division Zixibacteria bacterium]
MSGGNFLFSSESVTEGHPDKLADQISDAVLDEVLDQDPKGRVACETFVTVGLVIVGGEISTNAYVDINGTVRKVVKDIGYTHARYGFTYDTCSILNAIGMQSPDIAVGVDSGGAGDQGLMCGYACRETKEMMPMPIMLAHKLSKQLAKVRKKNILPWLGPDGKSQVTIEYIDGVPARCDTVVVSSQHTEEALNKSGRRMSRKAMDEIIEEIVLPIVPKKMLDRKTKYHINPTGRFLIGGPQSDTGMTGRKIIVDTYGGMAAHGGGAFSGKDPTKVDRSASYMARYIAKNVVASKLADKCTIQLAYAIGVPEPVSLMVFCDRSEKVPEGRIEQLIRKHFDMTPKGIIKQLKLLNPIYKKTAAYGHFGRTEKQFTWEQTDKARKLAKDA